MASCIYCDNIGSKILTRDLSFHAQTKHIDIQHHYVQECVEASDISYAYMPTYDNLADCLTKSLARPQFQDLEWECMMTFQLEGGCCFQY